MNNIEKLKGAFYNSQSSDTAVVVSSAENRFYLSGFYSSYGFIVLTPDSSHMLLDSRYYEMATAKKASGEIPDCLEIVLLDSAHAPVISRIISPSCRKIAVEDRRITCFEKSFPDFQIVFLGDAIEKLRMIKSEREIEIMRAAQAITDRAFLHILDFISPRKTEKDVALELEFFMRKNGAQSAAFDTICLSGAKTSMPHGVPEDIPLTPNSFITMDFGAKFKGYSSDMTRTVVLGRADDEMRRVYNTVLEAGLLAIKTARAGVDGRAVDRAARDFIEENYKGTFGHSTGHSLGIEIHEDPVFSPSRSEVIPAGAVLSVEPGIYIEGRYGVRIEDVVVIGEEGCENITKSPKNLIEL